MRWIKIQVRDKKQSALAAIEMSRHRRIDCYGDKVYMVRAPALALLAELGITYTELGRGGFDYVEKTLRDALAAHVRRRDTECTGETAAPL